MKVRDVMHTQVVTATPDDSVRDAAETMVKHHISGLPVVDELGHLVGIVSEGDLIHRAELGVSTPRSWWLELFASSEDRAQEYLKLRGSLVRDVMTSDVEVVDEDTTLDQAALVMEERRIKRLPVLSRGKLVGLISRADLLRALASKAIAASPQLEDDRAIREKIIDEIEKAGLAAGIVFNIVVENGVAHLWGLVDGPREIQALEAIARSVAGEGNVVSHLGLRPSAISAA